MDSLLQVALYILFALGALATLFGVAQGVDWLATKYRKPRALAGTARVIGEPAVPKLRSGDTSRFVRDVEGADGMIVAANQRFTKAWEIQNVGSVVWEGRYLQRLGASEGPGLIKSPASTRIPTTQPGQSVQLRIEMEAPSTEGTTVARFKMADKDGNLVFPDRYPEGVFVTVSVVKGIKTPRDGAER